MKHTVTIKSVYVLRGTCNTIYVYFITSIWASPKQYFYQCNNMILLDSIN